MAVTVRIECQACESIEGGEYEGVIVLGKNQKGREEGTMVLKHECSDSEIMLMIADLLKYLSGGLDAPV